MLVEHLESIAHQALAECKRAKSKGIQSIDDKIVHKFLQDIIKVISPAPETQHIISKPLDERWESVQIHPPTGEQSSMTVPAMTTPQTTAPTTTAPITTAPTTTAPTTTAPTTTAPTTTAPPLTAPTKTPTVAKKEAQITIDPFISENLNNWVTSPCEFFYQASFSPEQGLCSYIRKLDESSDLYLPRRRLTLRHLYVYRTSGAFESHQDFAKHLKGYGIVLKVEVLDRWYREGRTYDLFARLWGEGALLATDMTKTEAEKFPANDKDRKPLLEQQRRRGIKKCSEACRPTAVALYEHLGDAPVFDKFISVNITTRQTTRKRRTSQTLSRQDGRPFHIDKTLVRFSPQMEHVSSPAMAEVRDVTGWGATDANVSTTDDTGGNGRLRSDVENPRQLSPSPTAASEPREDIDMTTKDTNPGTVWQGLTPGQLPSLSPSCVSETFDVRGAYNNSIDYDCDAGSRVAQPVPGGPACAQIPNPGIQGATGSETGLQQVLGPAARSPGSWPLDGDGDVAGQQVAQALLQMRHPGDGFSQSSGIFDIEIDALPPLDLFDIPSYTSNT